jgi:hypothetical protein
MNIREHCSLFGSYKCPICEGEIWNVERFTILGLYLQIAGDLAMCSGNEKFKVSVFLLVGIFVLSSVGCAVAEYLNNGHTVRFPEGGWAHKKSVEERDDGMDP